MFTVYATEDILAETLYRMRRKRPAAPGHMTSRVHDLIMKVRAVTQKQQQHFLERDGEADLPARLKKASCPSFAERVRQHLQILG